MASEVVCDTPDEEEDCFEKNILKNGRKFSEVFERIFQKYDRVFTEDEHGAAEIKSDTDIDHLLNSGTRSDDPLSALLELSSDESDLDDHEVAALLHQKVVRVKKEINWEEEELQHQQRQRMKVLIRDCHSDDSDYEDTKRMRPPRLRKKRGWLKTTKEQPFKEKAYVDSSKNEARLKNNVSVAISHQALTDMSGYEDLDSTNCSFETCLGDEGELGVTSAPESDRVPPVTSSTTLSISMCELGREDDDGSNVSGTDDERYQDVVNSPVSRTRDFISRVQSNELVSGYDTTFESEYQDQCDSKVLSCPEETDSVEDAKPEDSSEHFNSSQESSDVCAATVAVQGRSTETEGTHSCCDTPHCDHQQATRPYQNDVISSSCFSWPQVCRPNVQSISHAYCPASQHHCIHVASCSHIAHPQCSCRAHMDCSHCPQHCSCIRMQTKCQVSCNQQDSILFVNGCWRRTCLQPSSAVDCKQDRESVCETNSPWSGNSKMNQSNFVQETIPTHTPPISVGQRPTSVPFSSLPSFGLDCCNTDCGHCNDTVSTVVTQSNTAINPQDSQSQNHSVANSDHDLISSSAKLNPKNKKRSLNNQDFNPTAPRNKKQCT